MSSHSDLVPTLQGLDALDLGYLITVCSQPWAFRNWGERAVAAEQRAAGIISELVPGGMAEGHTVKHYLTAAQIAWVRNSYTIEGILKS